LVFGHSIHKAQIEFLSEVPQNSNVLIIGGGSGKFLRDLLIKSPVMKVVYIESSAKMIKLSREAIRDVHGSDRVEFRTGTESDIRDEELFDVVITHFFLNLFHGTDLRNVAGKLYSHLKPGGIWLFSDFRINNNGLRRIWQNLLLRIMYLFFKITTGLMNNTLESFNTLFHAIGLVKVHEKFFYAGMISASCWRKFPGHNDDISLRK
jgi:spermidine synthase